MKPSYSNPFRVYSPLAAAFSVALLIHLAAPAAEAAALTWTGGSGNWTNGSIGGWSGSWNNANPDTGTFNGAGGTVSLTNAITSGTLAFSGGNYTLQSNTLTPTPVTRVITIGDGVGISLASGVTTTIGAYATILRSTGTSASVISGNTPATSKLIIDNNGKLDWTGSVLAFRNIAAEVKTGGNITSNTSIVIGDNTASSNTALLVSGGAITITGTAAANLVVANSSGATSSSGSLKITSGTITIGSDTNSGIRVGGTTAGVGVATGVIDLEGGIVTANKFYEGLAQHSSTLNLHGGTIKALNDNSNFITLDNVWIKSGGVAFDTNGKALTITKGMLTDVSSLNGGLTLNDTAVTKGTLTLSGDNSYTGLTTVSAGTLNIQHANALGATAGGTTVTNAASLQLQGGLSYATEALSIALGASTTPLLRNVSGDNTWNGTITTTGSGSFARISSDSGLLTLANTITGSDAASSVVFQGAGNILVSGQITGAAGIFSGSTGGGTRTVSNTGNDFSGDVNISGGILKLGASGVIPNGVGKGNVVFSLASTATLDLNEKNEIINGLSSSGGVSSVVDNTAVGTATLTVGDNNQISTFGGVIKNTGGALALKKIGTGTQTLANTNTYTGITTISAGTLALGSAGTIASSPKIIVGDTGSSGTVLDVSAKSLGFAIVSGQTLSGIGTVDANTSATLGGGDGTKYTVTINGTHAVGNGPGSQTIDGNLSYGDSSIFEWDLNATNGADPGVVSNNGSYDKVAVTGDLGGAEAVFKVVLGANAFADAFWDTGKSWSDIYNVTGTSTDFPTIFTTVKWYEGTTEMTNSTATRGSFSVSGSTLTWSAVPEPTSALAGLLITAGLLRRRRA